ncbi:MAG TPA: type II toxin-antitoxin system HipA family toxin [Bacteroidota bacterium]|jgi:serine/threonine-protein kinase HipA|nr:type II toxin-antitoxin system HipA family toxin [Bacteroidota bacterium]
MAKAVKRVAAAKVLLWEKQIGAVAWDEQRGLATFEYTPAFIKEGFDISPLMMPRESGISSFPALARSTYYGLPGLLADSLPDKFGNALIDAWLVRQGRSKDDFSPVERLCYIGSRGMGALEFEPHLRREEQKSVPVEISEMIRFAQDVLDNRATMLTDLHEGEQAIETIIRIGTSAGGARAKALVAWNRETHKIRSGQVSPPPGFELWMLKFDGLDDKGLGISQGYGRIEYAYSRMAKEAGIVMSECHLHEENGRAHFMTRRFDRGGSGEKIHMQSLCGLAHYDFNLAGAYSYEQAFSVIQKLNLGYDTLEQMWRRMAFNIVARNQDDHTKNIAFLMDPDGKWRLSPAFDVIWAHNPSGKWTNQHQMSVNGKRDGFTREDLLSSAKQFGIKQAGKILDEVIEAVRNWPELAEESGVDEKNKSAIAGTHRLRLV